MLAGTSGSNSSVGAALANGLDRGDPLPGVEVQDTGILDIGLGRVRSSDDDQIVVQNRRHMGPAGFGRVRIDLRVFLLPALSNNIEDMEVI